MEKSKDLAVLILAAGSSSRLGEPKQLLKYNNETLIKIAVKKALSLSSNVKVILGHKETEIIKEIADFPISIYTNLNYSEGIGSTISFGINETNDFENTLIMLCDQPFIPLSHYENLIKNMNKESLIASQYDFSPTVPAIFSKKYYPYLLELKGDKGAKPILKRFNAPIIELDKKLAIDIDTVEDKIYLIF